MDDEGVRVARKGSSVVQQRQGRKGRVGYGTMLVDIACGVTVKVRFNHLDI
jgi:hypothetical protein